MQTQPLQLSFDFKSPLTIQTTCQICLNQYDNEQHAPMLVCYNQHCMCLTCIFTALQYGKRKDQIPCPFCKEPVVGEAIDKFRLVEELVKNKDNLKKYQGRVKKYVQSVKKSKRKLQQILQQERKVNHIQSKLLQSLYIEIDRSQAPKTQSCSKGSYIDRSRVNTVYSRLGNSKVKGKNIKDSSRKATATSRQKTNYKNSRKQVCQNYLFTDNERDVARSMVFQFADQERLDCGLDVQLCVSDEQIPLNPKKTYSKAYKKTIKKSLPFTVSDSSKINTDQLKVMTRNIKSNTKQEQRIACIRCLKMYNFQQLKELSLEKLNINEQYTQLLDSQRNLFPVLEKLDLSKNRFQRVPHFVYMLEKLKKLDLSKNNITVLTFQLSQLTKLVNLDLWDNQIELFPMILARLQKLKQVDLSNNKISHVPQFITQYFRDQGVKVDLFGNPLFKRKPFSVKKQKPELFLNKFIKKLNKNLI